MGDAGASIRLLLGLWSSLHTLRDRVFKMVDFNSCPLQPAVALHGKNKGEAFENVAEVSSRNPHSAVLVHDRLLAV